MKIPRPLNTAGLMHRGLPPQNGYYWVRRHGRDCPDIVEVYSGDVTFCGSDLEMHPREIQSCVFWGPLAPPDEMTIHFKETQP